MAELVYTGTGGKRLFFTACADKEAACAPVVACRGLEDGFE